MASLLYFLKNHYISYFVPCCNKTLNKGRIHSDLEAQSVVVARQAGGWSWCMYSQERELSADAS